MDTNNKIESADAYRLFLQKHKVNNIPNLDSLASFYIDHREDLNGDYESIYKYLVDYEPKHEISISEYRYYHGDYSEMYDLMPNSCDQYFRIERRGFVQISRGEIFAGCELARPTEESNSCKLWINTDINNLKEWYRLFLSYLENFASKEPEDNTSIKFCCNAQRNDIITIYTDYKYIENLLNFLKSVKSKSPELFYSPSKSSPIVPVLDDMVSYADVSFGVSYPGMISRIFEFLNSFDLDKDTNTKDEVFELTKNLILEKLINSLDTHSWDGQPRFINTKNLASFRDENGEYYSYERCKSQFNVLAEKLREQQTYSVEEYTKAIENID